MILKYFIYAASIGLIGSLSSDIGYEETCSKYKLVYKKLIVLLIPQIGFSIVLQDTL